jgi:hypothetical protein
MVALGVGANAALADVSIPWATQSVAASGSDSAEAEAISTMADGSSIVTGLFRGSVSFGSTTLVSSGNADVYVAKVDAAGTFQWATRAGASDSDGGYGVSALADGSAIVTGLFRGSVSFGSTTLVSSGNNDVFVAKISAAGAWVWATRAGGTGGDKAWYVRTSSDGSAIVTGYFSGAAAFGTINLAAAGGSRDDVFVAKISASGTWVWATSAGGTTTNDEGIGVSMLADGSSIVAGTFEGPASFGSINLTGTGGQDAFVAKVDADGFFVWAVAAGGATADQAFRVSTLADGSAIVEGYFTGTATFGSTTLVSAGGQDYFVAKVSASGAFLWATRAGGSGDDGDESWGVSALVDGSAIVSGSFQGTATFGTIGLTAAGSGTSDVFVAKVDASGAFLWAIKGGGNDNDYGWDVSALPDGAAIVTGPFGGSATFGSVALTSANTDVYLAKVVSPSAAPGSVTAMPASGQATVSWSVPVYSGGAAITSYTATASPGGATCTATAPATSCTVTGLTNGTGYTFTVTATNATGVSPASSASAAVTPTAAAAATTTIKLRVLPGSARLTSGETMRLRLRATNTGTATASSVRACLRIPTSLIVTRRGGATRSGRSFCFALGNLAAGASTTRTVTVRAAAQRAVTVHITGTARSAATSPALTTTRSRAVRITPTAAPPEPVTG